MPAMERFSTFQVVVNLPHGPREVSLTAPQTKSLFAGRHPHGASSGFLFLSTCELASRGIGERFTDVHSAILLLPASWLIHLSPALRNAAICRSRTAGSLIGIL